MGEVVVAAVAVGTAIGLDNMRASAAIGVVAPSTTRVRWLLALLMADALALIVGASVGAMLPVALTSVATVIGIVVLVAMAGLAFIDRDADDGVSAFADARLICGVPILLGFDNLAAGAALVAIGYPPLPTIPIAGTTAALLCLTGFVAGSAVSRFAGPRSHQLGGVLLSIAALLAFAEIAS